MRAENLPTPSSPETPPLAPYDPPAPAPQAAAWRRALKVVEYATPGRVTRLVRTTVTKVVVHPSKWM
ncbi:MAG: hypothetical protein ABJD53_05385 [Gammaproteobacteria bacterium]